MTHNMDGAGSATGTQTAQLNVPEPVIRALKDVCGYHMPHQLVGLTKEEGGVQSFANGIVLMADVPRCERSPLTYERMISIAFTLHTRGLEDHYHLVTFKPLDDVKFQSLAYLEEEGTVSAVAVFCNGERNSRYKAKICFYQSTENKGVVPIAVACVEAVTDQAREVVRTATEPRPRMTDLALAGATS